RRRIGHSPKSRIRPRNKKSRIVVFSGRDQYSVPIRSHCDREVTSFRNGSTILPCSSRIGRDEDPVIGGSYHFGATGRYGDRPPIVARCATRSPSLPRVARKINETWVAVGRGVAVSGRYNRDAVNRTRNGRPMIAGRRGRRPVKSRILRPVD